MLDADDDGMVRLGIKSEVQRLENLSNYNVVGIEPEFAYDNLVTLASNICGTPMAAVSIVTAERPWFKAQIGLQAEGTVRDISFCTHAIEQPDTFVVPDATKDARFATSPLVVNSPFINFYAGVPLISPEGMALGTLCVFDVVPRNRRGDALLLSNNRLQTIVESAPLAILTLTPDGIVQSWNPAAEKIFGYSAAEVVHRRLPIVPELKQYIFMASLESIGRRKNRQAADHCGYGAFLARRPRCVHRRRHGRLSFEAH